MVPDRGAPVAFGSTLNWTAPSPLPEAPPVTAIQGTWLTAVHAQPTPAATLTEPGPPAAGIGWAEALSATVQPLS